MLAAENDQEESSTKERQSSEPLSDETGPGCCRLDPSLGYRIGRNETSGLVQQRQGIFEAGYRGL